MQNVVNNFDEFRAYPNFMLLSRETGLAGPIQFEQSHFRTIKVYVAIDTCQTICFV